MSHSNAILTVDLSAIADNYRLLQSMASTAECGAVVKANAYGLGVDKVAPALAAAGCRSFFVATLDEGIALRKILPTHDIYVFGGIAPKQDREFVQYLLIPVLNELDQIMQWNNAAIRRKRKLAAVIHIDTGMCRLGLSKPSALYLAEHRHMISDLDIRYIMSHLSCAEEPDHFQNSRQYTNFREIISYESQIKLSLANSAGIFLGDKFHFDLVRPGCALYGINPAPYMANPMKHVVTLTSPILQIRDIDTPQSVGYGATYEAAAGSRIATIGTGYADGYMRSLSNKGIAIVGGETVPIIGRVSMDLMTIDITTIPRENIQLGMHVELISERCPVDRVADMAGTSGYEILTRLGSRFKREYI